MTSNLRRWTALAPMLLALAATPACLRNPAVSVHHAELRGLSAWGLNVSILLQVRNDNGFDIQIRNVNANVTFGRGLTLPVAFAPNQWLPANQTTYVYVPVTLPWVSIPALVSETTGAYAIPYHVRGYADVTATRALAIDRDNYTIDESGVIPRQMVVDAARTAIPLPTM